MTAMWLTIAVLASGPAMRSRTSESRMRRIWSVRCEGDGGTPGVGSTFRVRLPFEKKLITEVRAEKGFRVEEVQRTPNGLITTTVGRVQFNDILHPKMAFYDLPLTGKHLSRSSPTATSSSGEKRPLTSSTR
jgi:hypothetical protein